MPSAVYWQMAKRWGWYAVTRLMATGFANLFAICWQMAKIICHPLADGKELADGNHVLCRLSVLCHLFFISRWQRRSLPSAGRWQRGHVSSTCNIWAGLFGLFAICRQMAKLFAMCWQTAKHAPFAICWHTAKSLHTLPSAGRRQRACSLCHLLADNKVCR